LWAVLARVSYSEWIVLAKMVNFSPDATLHERFALVLHCTAREWRRAVDRRLKYLGVSQAQWMVIANIARADHPLSQSELADLLAVEGATVVSMIDRLVGAGFVLRVGSSSDRRVKHIVLTDVGKQMHDSVETEALNVRQLLLSRIDAEELERATELLERLLVELTILA
jgi:MarR family transcriptional regulator for hemolysin